MKRILLVLISLIATTGCKKESVEHDIHIYEPIITEIGTTTATFEAKIDKPSNIDTIFLGIRWGINPQGTDNNVFTPTSGKSLKLRVDGLEPNTTYKVSSAIKTGLNVGRMSKIIEFTTAKE